MNITVLIDNYNYGRFLGRCLESVLAQNTAALHEIILVDDGSTDDSLTIAGSWAARDSRIRIVAKANGGQLSAFNAGFEKASGDIVCFLDADDEYKPGYLSRLLEVFGQNPEVDFVFCRCEPVGGHFPGTPPWELIPGGSFDFGLTPYRTGLLRQWIGAPTSCIASRRRLLSKFLPCMAENDYRVSADDVLVYGASLFEGRKYYLAEKWVRYHFHGDNHWLTSSPDLRSKQAQDRRFSGLIQHWGIDLPGGRNVGERIVREFQNIPRPTLRDRRHYSRMIRRFALHHRIKYRLQLWHRWLGAKSMT